MELNKNYRDWLRIDTPLDILCEIASSESFDINFTDKYDRNLLHTAVLYNKADVVEFLLCLPGIDVNKKDSHGNIPLHMANDFRIAKRLIMAGADPFARNNYNVTPCGTKWGIFYVMDALAYCDSIMKDAGVSSFTKALHFNIIP